MTRYGVVFSASPVPYILFLLQQVKWGDNVLANDIDVAEGEITGFAQRKGCVPFYDNFFIFCCCHRAPAEPGSNPQNLPRVSHSVIDCKQLVSKTCARHLGAALTP